MGTPPIQIGILGMADSLILMVMALVVFGPRRLPQIGRQIGKLMYEFRKASNDFKFQMEEELRNAEEADRRKTEEAERQRALAAAPPPAQLEASTNTTPEAATEIPDSYARDYESSSKIQDSNSKIQDSSSNIQPEQSATPSATPAATAPSIQPPSTGEPVAANRPGAAPPAPEQAMADAATAETEPARPHG
jgi:sec-independent protein translocase protein TatB